MRFRIAALVLAALLSLSLAGSRAADAAREPQALRVGAVAYGPNSVNIFRSMRHYFAQNHMPIEFVLYSTYDGLVDALRKGQVEVAWNSPLAHARFHLLEGDSQALVMRDVDRDYRVKLIVRKDADIAGLGDLAGKTMVFGSCDAADATVLPVYFLKKEGVSFDRVKVLSLHCEVDAKGVPCHSQQHVLQALLKGRGQAGIIGQDLWKHLQAEKPEQAAQFREVWTSPPFSHCVFTARKDFDKETAAKFSRLMLAMDGKDPATAEVLRGEHCGKWVPAGKEAQEGYRDLLKALRESPLPAAIAGKQ